MLRGGKACGPLEYARISGRKSDTASGRHNRDMPCELQWHRYAPKQEFEGEFNLRELEAALKRLKPKKSGGQDRVAPELVQQLPTAMEEELLKVLNVSWLTWWCP